MPTLSVPAALPGAGGGPSGVNGSADLGTISVHVLLHPEPFLARGDGQRAVEHPIDRWPEPMVECPRKAHREVRCYIEVEQDNYFAFEFSVSNRSVVTADGLKFAIFLDDHYVDYAFMEKKDCDDPPFVGRPNSEPVAWKRGVARCGRSTKKSGWFEKSFYFKPISFVKNVTDLGMAMRQEKRGAGMGNLRIEVYRLIKNERALERSEVSENTTEYHDYFLTEKLAIHRDFLHNRSATLSATLMGNTRSLNINVGREFGHIDGALRPMAVFNFEYRTREILRKLGYEPPANVPAPTAGPTIKHLLARDFNSLSKKEKAQVVRQRKEATATSGSISGKGVKLPDVPQYPPRTKQKRKRETSPSGNGGAQENPRVEVKIQGSNGTGLTKKERAQKNKKEETQKGKKGKKQKGKKEEKQKGKKGEKQKSKKGRTQSLLHDAPSAPKRMRIEQAKASGSGGR